MNWSSTWKRTAKSWREIAYHSQRHAEGWEQIAADQHYRMDTLVEMWERQMREYPNTERGRLARIVTRACAREVTAFNWGDASLLEDEKPLSVLFLLDDGEELASEKRESSTYHRVRSRLRRIARLDGR